MRVKILLKAVSDQCFLAGTLVHKDDGLVPIEEIQVGDLVASRDEATGEITWHWPMATP